MYWVWQILGVALILAAMVDVFHTIFHPTETGTIGDAVARTIWRVSRFIATKRRSALSAAGPAAVVSIIVMWLSMIIAGFALVYWPYLDSGFGYTNPAEHARHHGFLDAINISPNGPWMRLIMGLEAAFGFGILSASISWILSIYPILERRRSLAHAVVVLRDAERAGQRMTQTFAIATLGSFTQQLITLRSDFLHFPVTFYFHEERERAGLSNSFTIMREFADWAGEGSDDGLRITGAMLGSALDDVLKLVTDYAGVPFESTPGAIEELAKEHMRDGTNSHDEAA
jgi:hypothetical protein